MPDSLTLNMNTESQNNYSGWKRPQEVIAQSPSQNRVNTGLRPGKKCFNQKALSLLEHLGT